jgi:hypothetical protein
MFKPPLLLTLGYLASVAIYHIALCFLLGQRLRDVEPGLPTLWAHGALLGAGSFGLSAYGVLARRAPRERRAGRFYLGGLISAGLFAIGLVLLKVDYYMTRTFYLVSPTIAVVVGSLVVTHFSLGYFERKRPLSYWLTAILVLVVSLVGFRPFYVVKPSIDMLAAPLFVANVVVCLLLAYRLLRIWLKKE